LLLASVVRLRQIRPLSVVIYADGPIPAQTHGLVDAHATDVRVDAEALADGVAAPDEADVATLLRYAAQVAEPGFAGGAGLGVLETHAVENRLVDRQAGQFDPGGEVGAGVGQRRDEPARVAEDTAGVPLHHHPGRTIGAAPDHCLVALQVAGLHAIGQLWTILDRSDHCGGQAGQENTGAYGLHDTTASEIEIAHGELPEKAKC